MGRGGSFPLVGTFPSSRGTRPSIGGSGRSVRWLDLVVLLWIAVWVVMGVVIGIQVRNLRQLSDTVVGAGSAVQKTGQALRPLSGLPFVGSRIDRVERQIEAAGVQAQASGEQSRRSIGSLSILLGVAIILIPTVPLAAVYVPLRLSWARDVRAVRRSLARWDGDPAFVEFLARRAVLHLPYHHLRDISTNPWRDLESGRYEHLALAELRRLGIRAPLAPRGSRNAA